MPILRAGPWAGSAPDATKKSFIDAPTYPTKDVNDVAGPFPVNAANSFSDTWPWRYVSNTQLVDFVFEYDLFDAADSTSRNGILSDTGELVCEVGFAYQAAQDWSFSALSVFASSDGGNTSRITVWGLDELVKASAEDTAVDAPTNITSFTFPATVVPNLVFMEVFAGEQASGQVSATIEWVL